MFEFRYRVFANTRKEGICYMGEFFAGYNFILTDVAIFQTEEARDKWVKEESTFERIPLSREQAIELVGSGVYLHNTEPDIFDESIKWAKNCTEC